MRFHLIFAAVKFIIKTPIYLYINNSQLKPTPIEPSYHHE